MAKSAVHTFGKYQILERIATGGTAEIYKAKHEGIGGFKRTFAIKRILPNLSQHSDYIAMLVDEAKVAGLLSHANIVQILDLGQVDGIWYIAMEYVDGQDLGAVLRRANRKGLCLPVPHAVFTAIELLKGLEYAHQRQVMRGGKAVPLNIIHRDISPPNVLLSYQGEVKLTDFGIARASLKMMETVSGIVKGRFDYMSPEQAEGRKDLDQRSDLFSVGVVLYQMLTGVHPFRAESELGTVERVRTGKYTPVSTRNPEVPFALQTIIDRALQVDRDKRYPSATAFKEALDRFFHDAGFIFTHATLATYVKGLFPEAQGPRAPSGDPNTSPRVEPNTSPRPSDRRSPDATGDYDATGVMEYSRTGSGTGEFRRPAGDTATPTGGMSSREDLEATAIRDNPFSSGMRRSDITSLAGRPARSAAAADEQETVIRRMDASDPRGSADLSQSGPFGPGEPTRRPSGDTGEFRRSNQDFGDDEEVATVIRQSPFEEGQLDAAQALDPVPRGTGGEAFRSDLSEARRISVDGGDGIAHSYTGVVPTRPALIGWLGVVLSILCLLAGIGIGSVMTGGGAYLLGLGRGPGDALPVVRVLAQRDVDVYLDGQPAKRNFTIPPDTQKNLEVRAEGHAWSIPLKMAPGEVQVFIIRVPTPTDP